MGKRNERTETDSASGVEVHHYEQTYTNLNGETEWEEVADMTIPVNPPEDLQR